MSADLEFTGERFVPGIAGEIAHEHWHRYAFARRFATGRRVLDAACGEGYGSAMLAAVADDVIGLDIDEAAVAHARAAYGGRAHLNFAMGSANALRLPDASIDLVVSFETIEHLPASAQPQMLAEFARVLAPGGLLLLSAPNRVEYSDIRNYRNPFHLHEHDRAELAQLLDVQFPVQRWFAQRRYFGSAIWTEGEATGFEAWLGSTNGVQVAGPPIPMYFVVLAAQHASAMPGPGALTALSLCSDEGESELQRLDAQAGEVLRLDGLLRQRDVDLDRQAAYLKQLEELAQALEAQREAAAAELADTRSALSSRDQAFRATAAEVDRLERALTAQERIIAYRQSARWWLQLPWLRCRLWWERVHGK